MELLLAIALGVVTACAVYLLLRGRTFSVVLGLSLLGYATNVFIFTMGRLAVGAAPVVREGAAAYADPLPQALVLTAIVIGFGMTAYIVGLAVRASRETGSDHVDGCEPGERKRRR
jgi:multicomponent K+:H+ antiporter subunit C